MTNHLSFYIVYIVILIILIRGQVIIVNKNSPPEKALLFPLFKRNTVLDQCRSGACIHLIGCITFHFL